MFDFHNLLQKEDRLFGEVLYKNVKQFSQKHPFVFLICMLSGLGLAYYALKQFAWGVVIANFVATMVSTEAGVGLWFSDGYLTTTIVVIAAAANILNLGIDLLVVRQMLYMEKVVAIIDLINNSVAALWWAIVGILGFQKKENRTDYTDQVKHAVHGLAHWKLLIVIFACGAAPRLMTVVIGGTVIGVFLINYKRLGWLGWLALSVGIGFRIAYVIAFWRRMYP
ncbi:MAG: hypothetical protein V1668_04960 [Patescibacteria group bacterium]